jgi:hypothetical protein
MAHAMRQFVSDMMFVSIGKRSPDRTFKLAALVDAMLHHCHGLKPEAEVAYCTPANSVLAKQLHCSPPTIKRLMKDLREGGNLIAQRRGEASNAFTIYKYPRSSWKSDQPAPQESKSDGSGVDPYENRLRWLKEPPQMDQPAKQRDQDAGQMDQQSPSEGSGVEPLRDNIQGKNTSGKNNSGTSSKGTEDSTGRLGVSEVGGSDSPKEDLVTFEAFKAILDSAVQILPGEPAYQLDGEIHRVIDSGKVKSAYEWRTAILFRKAEINEQAAKGTRPNYKHPNTTDWLLWDFWVLCGRFAGPKSDASAKLLADMNGAAQAGFQVV